MKDKTIEGFVRELASSNATPGGGAVAALAGALSGALMCMVANVTLTKGDDPELKRLHDEAEKLFEACLIDLGVDAEAFDDYMKAVRLPRATDEEKAARKARMQATLRRAAEVPLATAERIVALLRIAQEMARRARGSVISDLGVANFMALSGLMSAMVNVEINLNEIDDGSFIKASEKRLGEFEEEAHDLFPRIEAIVKERMAAKA